MNHYRVIVNHNGEEVQVYPQRLTRGDTNLEDVCIRIGMMVMSNGIECITVYRDGEVYRTVNVEQVKPCKE